MHVSPLSDRTREEWEEFFAFHGDMLQEGRDRFILAARAYYDLQKRCGTIESDPGPDTYIVDLLDRAHGPLAEEVREFLVW